MAELETFHGRIVANLDLAMNVFASGDIELARQLLRQKTQVRELERKFIESHFERIGARRPDSMISSALHLDVLRDLKRINRSEERRVGKEWVSTCRSRRAPHQ